MDSQQLVDAKAAADTESSATKAPILASFDFMIILQSWN